MFKNPVIIYGTPPELEIKVQNRDTFRDFTQKDDSVFVKRLISKPVSVKSELFAKNNFNSFYISGFQNHIYNLTNALKEKAHFVSRIFFFLIGNKTSKYIPKEQ
ncbi:MAG TPA: hypothetical protein PK908_08590 [Bacteroidales bacterium]|nr:hypothetical protein [Bacteroidales bacterium]